MTEYKKLTDEELIRRLRMGETGIIDYLMEKYKNLVRKEANAMYQNMRQIRKNCLSVRNMQSRWKNGWKRI